MALPVRVVVNGLAGPLCTVEAESSWSAQDVLDAVRQKTGQEQPGQVLLQETQILNPKDPIASLITVPGADLTLSLVVKSQVAAQPGPVAFEHCRFGLEQVGPGHLRKTSKDVVRYDATAISSACLVVGTHRGLRFELRDRNFMMGLGSTSTPPDGLHEIDLAMGLNAHGDFGIYERGNLVTTKGTAREGIVELVVKDGLVEVWNLGFRVHTYQLQGSEVLYAMACCRGEGKDMRGICWLE